MPDNISTIQGPARGPQPTDLAADAAREAGVLEERFARASGEALGGAISRFGGATDTVVREVEMHQGMAEISHGAASLARLQSDLTQQWNDTAKNTDPNDRSIAKGFEENTLEPSLANFQSQFTTDAGQKWALEQADALRQHMFVKTSADMSTRAGIAVQQNLSTVMNSLSTTVYNDPSSLNHSLGVVDSTLNGVIAANPNLSAADAAKIRDEYGTKMKHEIAQAAFGSYLDAGPDGPKEALKLLNSGKLDPYLEGTDKAKMTHSALIMQKANDESARVAEADQRRRNGDALSGDLDKLYNAAQHPQDPLRPAYDADYIKNVGKVLLRAAGTPGGEAAAAEARAMLREARTVAQEQLGERDRGQTDNGVYKDFADRMLLPDSDPRKLTASQVFEARAQGKLDDHDKTFFVDGLKTIESDPRLHSPMLSSAMQAAKDQLTYAMPGLPGKDPKGQAAYATFVDHFWPQYVKAAQAGTIPPNALDMNDPKSMIRQALDPVNRTGQQKLADRLAEISSLGTSTFTPPKEWLIKPATDKTPVQYYDPKEKKYYDADGKEMKP